MVAGAAGQDRKRRSARKGLDLVAERLEDETTIGPGTGAEAGRRGQVPQVDAEDWGLEDR